MPWKRGPRKSAGRAGQRFSLDVRCCGSDRGTGHNLMSRDAGWPTGCGFEQVGSNRSVATEQGICGRVSQGARPVAGRPRGGVSRRHLLVATLRGRACQSGARLTPPPRSCPGFAESSNLPASQAIFRARPDPVDARRGGTSSACRSRRTPRATGASFWCRAIGWPTSRTPRRHQHALLAENQRRLRSFGRKSTSVRVLL